MKRILALLLVVAFALTALLACNNGEGDPTEPASESSTPSSTKPTEKPRGTTTETDTYGQNKLISAVPVDDLDFGGEEIVILTRSDPKVFIEWGREDLEGDELNDAILTRNAKIASDLGLLVQIEAQYGDDAPGNYETMMRNDVTQGYHNYDIVSHYAYYAVTSGNRAYSTNLLDEDVFPYFDFELPCWNQAIYNNGTINGVNYMCAGDMNLSLWNCAMIFWQNVTLYDELKKPDQPENIQDLVLAGDWTLSQLYDWTSVYENTSAKGDCGDTYGVYLLTGAYSTNPNDVLPYAWDIPLMKTNPQTGRHEFLMKDNSKAEEAIEMMIIMKDNVGNAFKHDKVGGGSGCDIDEFAAGNVVFKTDVIFFDEGRNLRLREMEDVYALLPWPKYDENQTGYKTTAMDFYNIMTVVNHSENVDEPIKGEQISAYLQYSTEYSYEYVRAYYHERIVKPKTLALREEVAEKSMKIFDDIISNIEFEFWSLYSEMLGGTMHIFRNAIRYNSTLKETFEKDEKTYVQKLEDADVFFGIIETEE